MKKKIVIALAYTCLLVTMPLVSNANCAVVPDGPPITTPPTRIEMEGVQVSVMAATVYVRAIETTEIEVYNSSGDMIYQDTVQANTNSGYTLQKDAHTICVKSKSATKQQVVFIEKNK